MARADELRARLLTVFAAEAEEHMSAVGAGLAALEREPPLAEAQDHVERVFRALHTLKGAARSVSLREIEARCQELEQELGELKLRRSRPTRPAVARLHARVDEVARLLRAAGSEPPAARPAGAPAGAVGPPPAGRALRVAADQLESLHVRAEELLGVKLALEERVREARRMAEELGQRPSAPGGALLAGSAPSRGAAARVWALHARLAGDQRSLALAVDGLHRQARRLRTLPASSMLEPLARMSGELARAQGKELDVEIAGGEQELDRRVLEAIKDPLLHLLRNAVDHGIEAPERRVALGKPRRGRLAVRVSPLEGRKTQLSVEDDGGGLDVAALRAAAVRARAVGAEEAGRLDEHAAMRLALVSGVSTSSVVGEISGHGLGMAIAREAVEGLGGGLQIETRAGAGTTIRLRVASTITEFEGLLVRAGSQRYLIPITAVERIARVSADQLSAAAGRTLLTWHEEAMPAGALATLMGGADRVIEGQKRPCVLLAVGGERGALLVDEMLGAREALVKELEPPLVRVRHVSGAGLLGSGELVLILRPADLLDALREPAPLGGEGEHGEPPAPPAILVVDDSITTRTMERNLLEAAGYRVAVAVDGIEALAALRAAPCDLVVSDVDMPRMNGFELTERIRSDPRLASLPVVLLTALESREDKERGVEVGANAYVIKSAFDESKLLEIIRRLV